MGLCISSLADGGDQTQQHQQSAAGADCRAYVSPCSRQTTSFGGNGAQPSLSISSSGGGGSVAAPSQTPPNGLPLDAAVLQVHGFQAALAAVSDTPGLGLSEAAELLLGELDASLVSIHRFCDCTEADTQQPQSADLLQPQPPGPHYPACAVLLAACGNGAESLERSPVMTDPAASCLLLRTSGLDSLTASAPNTNSGRALAPAHPLPADWEALRCNSGLQSFLAVPIGPVVRPWGVLTLAAEAPDALPRPRWQAWPGVAAVALVHLVRHWQCAAICSFFREAAVTSDRLGFICLLLRACEGFMARAINAAVGIRLAVMDGPPSGKALVFELKAVPQGSPGSTHGCSLVASEMDLSGTLLCSAIAMRKARYIRDCAMHLQGSRRPARDIFTQPARLVSSLVAVPLVRGDDEPPVAAIYLTMDAPSDFRSVQEPLLGLVNSVLPTVDATIRVHRDAIWDEAQAVRLQGSRLRARRASDGSSAVGSVRGGCAGPCANGPSGELPQISPFVSPVANGLLDAAGAGRSSNGAATGSPCGPLMVISALPGGLGYMASDPGSMDVASGQHGVCTSSLLSSCNSKRLCTGAMLKVVEQEIAKCKHLNVDSGALPSLLSPQSSGFDVQTSDLVLLQLIGVGGYGAVWRGTWRRVTAAIKVMHHRGTEQEAMMDAVEMAVLSAVSHPNVVQVFACLTDMVEVPADSSSSPRGSGGPASAAFLPSFDRGNGGGGSAAPSQAGGLMAGGLGRRWGPGPEGPVPPPAPSYRRLLPFEDPEDAPTCSVVVMEYCDLGTLRRMAQRGLFHQRIGGGPAGASGSSMAGGGVGHGGGGGGTIGVDLAALVEVALQVAEALAYLHSIRLCHCDVKLDNVLLKSEVPQPRGYIAKLGDMGLVKVLGAADAVVNVACAGTVNHLAPELFTPGSRLTTAVDVYAFGILLYELYMAGATAYAGLSKSAIIERVARAGMRPRFPAGAPRAYVELAAACWAQDPAHRPGFGSIIAALQAILNTMAAHHGALLE